MKASDLITRNIPALKTSDTGAIALRLMNEFHVKHLPVVNETLLLGLISEDDILNAHGVEENIGNIPIAFIRPYIHQSDHIFEITKVAHEFKLTVLPVVDEHDLYAGCITTDHLFHQLLLETTLLEPGGLIVIEMNKNDYSLAEIAHIIESENTKILSAFSKSLSENNLMELTIKLNQTELQTIISSLARHNYSVKATFRETEYFSDLKERYDSLMNYLDI